MIKDKHFWCLFIPSDCSWIWRKVLKLRSIAINFVQFSIGNGLKTSLWFDPWVQHKPFVSFVHDPLIINSGILPKARVADILNASGWHCLTLIIRWLWIFVILLTFPDLMISLSKTKFYGILLLLSKLLLYGTLFGKRVRMFGGGSCLEQASSAQVLFQFIACFP